MVHRTKIQWCDFATNPLRARANGDTGWACEKISPGCAGCYAESINRRFGTKRKYNKSGTSEVEHYLDEKELRHILRFKPRGPFKGGDRPRVFPFDMTDVFGDWVPFDLIDRLFAHFAMRPDADFLVLTKRPERMAEYCEWAAAGGGTMIGPGCGMDHVWLGTSTEDQPRADQRTPHLLRCPAAVRFLSIEPLLGPVNLCRVPCDITEWTCGHKSVAFVGDYYPERFTNPNPEDMDDPGWKTCCADCGCEQTRPLLHWVIVGCESGPRRRPCELDWVRSIRDQCAAAGVALFVKQLSIKGRVTGEIDDFPDDLRVREFPEPAGATA